MCIPTPQTNLSRRNRAQRAGFVPVVQIRTNLFPQIPGLLDQHEMPRWPRASAIVQSLIKHGPLAISSPALYRLTNCPDMAVRCRPRRVVG